VSNEQQQKDLIMALVSYYSWEDLKPFFLSLRNTGYDGDIVLFINHIDDYTQWTLKNTGLNITLIPYEQTGLLNVFQMPDYRYYLYLNYLESNSYRYKNILLTDVRDVYFQVNPSHVPWAEGGITVAKEAVKIKDEFWNTRWILTRYGHYVYSQLEEETVICSGTTWGPADQIVTYLKKMVHYLFFIDYYRAIVNDQAVHNYLVHTKKIEPIAFADNENGPIMTLSFEDDANIKINEHNQILLKNGAVAPILHQYDRKPHLVSLIRNSIQ
jgi:hypothetical protein